MKILLTGGTGVIGRGAISPLLRAGHRVRLLSRQADEAVHEWPHGVEPFQADVTQPAELKGAADGCDAVIHVTGIVTETPGRTFDAVNIKGTGHVLREAERAGVPRFIYVSSLGAGHGTSEYHRSKRAAEKLVHAFAGSWLVLRPGNVYGPGDEMVSRLLAMVRAQPVVPMVGDGEQQFQPLWYADFGQALAQAVERPDLSSRTLELVGTETTTTRDLIERLSKITHRLTVRMPIPETIASTGTAIAAALGIELPLDQQKLTMLLEEHIVAEGQNALTHVFAIEPTLLYEGLGILVDDLPEQMPADGVGDLELKRFWADIIGSDYTAPELLERFRRRCAEILPIDLHAEPGTPSVVELGRTLTMKLPLRGNIQVRVEEITDRHITLATLKGHPLAGVIRFSTTQRGPDQVRFEIDIHARAANAADWLAMRALGDPIQTSNWMIVVNRVIELSGGASPDGVETESRVLDEAAARKIDHWIRTRIAARKRDEEAA